MYPIIPVHETENWQYQDIIKDTIAGISLERAQELVADKENTTVTVAIIDTPIEISHEHLKNNIWINTSEIPNNNIDDDKNGYIDDIHGWNFMGNANGVNDIYIQMESTRLLKKYETQRQKNIKESTYILAKKLYDSMYKKSKKEYDHYSKIYEVYYDIKREMSKKSLNDDYSIKQLDSIKDVYADDWLFKSAVTSLINLEKYISRNDIIFFNELYTKHLEVLFNKDYNDREIKGDNPNDLNDSNYGNNIINHNLDKLKHGTFVSAPMVQSSKSQVQGISSKIKIMPVCISGYGSEHDKDIALAIRYAVDNGAKVINISLGKLLSLRKEWVFEAFKYAEQHDVIIVSSAGDHSLNLTEVNYYYPNDNEDNGTEVSNNFLLVGASTYDPNEKLVAPFSNYGNIDVDIFAPGIEIFTTTVHNTYDFEDGTAMATSITSGVAALIFSYYPNLTAWEVKQIIMKSGVSYDIMVNKPSTNRDKELVPFSSLSKSGKVVNAYNALLLAEEVSKKKKKPKK
ncbi:MAG: S8 family serine peptidase [Kordia sp.]|uniref:S8 family serine peptidase n=1 Tax=Kordia sp. TaxID=1965332 RepID=UPI003859FD1E